MTQASGSVTLSTVLGSVEFDYLAEYEPPDNSVGASACFTITSVKLAGTAGPELLPAFEAIDGTDVLESIAWESWKKENGL